LCGQQEVALEIGKNSTNGIGSRSMPFATKWSRHIEKWIKSKVNESLRTTLADVVAFLESNGVAYALVGGLAVSARGQPRVTVDVDMILGTDIDSALRLAENLEITKFKPLFDDVATIVQQAFILPLRHRQTNVKVDLAIGMSGFEQQAIARAQVMDAAGTKVRVATSEDLLVMKVLAGRPQDEQDLQGLVIAQGDRLDWPYCLNVAEKLGEAIGQDLASRVRSLRSSQVE
jgi:hypothetical protein